MTVKDGPHCGRFDVSLGREHLDGELIEISRRRHDLVRRVHVSIIRDSCVTWRMDMLRCFRPAGRPARSLNTGGVAMMISLLPALLRDWRGFSLSGVIPDA